jgi:hypothetical protein
MVAEESKVYLQISVAQEKDVDLARSFRHGEVVLVSWEGLKLVS